MQILHQKRGQLSNHQKSQIKIICYKDLKQKKYLKKEKSTFIEKLTYKNFKKKVLNNPRHDLSSCYIRSNEGDEPNKSKSTI